MTLDRALRWGMAVLAALLLAWLSQALEWTEIETRQPAQGEAATNPWYASQHLVRRLGGAVVQSDSLRTLPPPGARLILTSPHWDLFPGNLERLRQWVEQGGDLIIPAYFLQQKKFSTWIPMQRASKKPTKPGAALPAAKDTEDDDEGDDYRPLTTGCHPTKEQQMDAPANTTPRSFLVCAVTYRTLETPQPVLWGLTNEHGYEALRVALGQGSVTALEADELGMHEELFSADNAQAWVRALNLRAHSVVWFVINEKRPPLFQWLWTQGWVALLLFAALTGLALWRNGMRLGPVAPAPTLARRSMAEQVRGTAQFLRRRSAPTLHQALLRALDETAVHQVRHYRSLNLQDRAQSVARITQLDTPALTYAMRTDAKRSTLATLQTLRLLETARRRLRSKHRPESHSHQP